MKKTQVSKFDKQSLKIDKLVTPDKGQRALQQVSERLERDLLDIAEKALKRAETTKETRNGYGAFYWTLYHACIVELVSHTVAFRHRRTKENDADGMDSMFSEMRRHVGGEHK